MTTKCKIYFTGIINPETSEEQTNLVSIDNDVEDKDVEVAVVNILPVPAVQGYYAEYTWEDSRKGDDHAV